MSLHIHIGLVYIISLSSLLYIDVLFCLVLCFCFLKVCHIIWVSSQFFWRLQSADLAYPQMAKASQVANGFRPLTWRYLASYFWRLEFIWEWYGYAWIYMCGCVMMCMHMYDLLSRCWKWRWTRQLEYPFCVYFFGHFKSLTKGVKWLKWQAMNIQFGSHIQFGSRHVLSLKRLTKLKKDMEEVVRTTVSQLKHVSRKAFWSDWSIAS